VNSRVSGPVAESNRCPTYTDAMAPKMDGFYQWYDSLSDDEREAQAADCAATVGKLEGELRDGDSGR
jgi:hypothetical protein